MKAIRWIMLGAVVLALAACGTSGRKPVDAVEGTGGPEDAQDRGGKVETADQGKTPDALSDRNAEIPTGPDVPGDAGLDGPDLGPDGPDATPPDGGVETPVCTPACGGKECGPDGCNGSCGACAASFQCIQGQCQPIAAGPNNLGIDFWAVDLDNAFVPGGPGGYYDAASQQFAVVVTNPSADTPAEIAVFDCDGPVLADAAGQPLADEPVWPGDVQVLNLPRLDADGTIVGPRAYRITSSIPIAAYQFNPLENVAVYSNDASVLFPRGSLGTHYFVMTREQSFQDLRSYVTVVAVAEGDTEVVATVSTTTAAGINEHTGEEIPHLEPGDSFSVTLQQFDVLNLETDAVGADMTGTEILATQEVVVFGGSEASNAPNLSHCLIPLPGAQGKCEYDMESPCKSDEDCIGFNVCCADHLEHQLIPVPAWGLKYSAAKTFPRNKEKDVYRVVAAQNGTTVTTIPPQIEPIALQAGLWVDFESDQDFTIAANKPILVGQFLAGQDAPEPNINGVPQPAMDAGIGDPTFILLAPDDQFLPDYAFLAPDKYVLDYVTIVAPVTAKVWFDCEEIDPADIEAKCDPLSEDEFAQFAPVGDGAMKATRFEINDGPHRVHASAPIGAYVYGYDQYVSYGYAAGMAVRDLGLAQ